MGGRMVWRNLHFHEDIYCNREQTEGPHVAYSRDSLGIPVLEIFFKKRKSQVLLEATGPSGSAFFFFLWPLQENIKIFSEHFRPAFIKTFAVISLQNSTLF